MDGSIAYSNLRYGSLRRGIIFCGMLLELWRYTEKSNQIKEEERNERTITVRRCPDLTGTGVLPERFFHNPDNKCLPTV